MVCKVSEVWRRVWANCNLPGSPYQGFVARANAVRQRSCALRQVPALHTHTHTDTHTDTHMLVMLQALSAFKTTVLQSVINRPLLERLDLLKAAIVTPPAEGILVGKGTVKGSLAKLVPNEVVLDHTICSKICHSMEDIQAAFDEAIRVQVSKHELCSG